jgi:hypothetical protein
MNSQVSGQVGALRPGGGGDSAGDGDRPLHGALGAHHHTTKGPVLQSLRVRGNDKEAQEGQGEERNTSGGLHGVQQTRDNVIVRMEQFNQQQSTA